MPGGVRYTPEEIASFSVIGVLPKEALDVIEQLAGQVGASDYIRTPQFQKTSAARGRRRGRGAVDQPADGWGSTRRPRVAKKEGIDGIISSIRVHLNKITVKTFAEQTEAVRRLVESLGEDMAHALPLVADALFTIASGNAFYSSLYADLYGNLSGTHEVLLSTLESHLDGVGALFDSIEWCDPNDDYDRFCDINKTNDKRRALALFCVNLMKRGLVPVDRVEAMIVSLESRLVESVDGEGAAPVNEELSELLFALVVNAADPSHLNTHAERKAWFRSWRVKPCVEEYTRKIAGMKARDHPGLSNKAVFKHMDMQDSLRKLISEMG